MYTEKILQALEKAEKKHGFRVELTTMQKNIASSIQE